MTRNGNAYEETTLYRFTGRSASSANAGLAVDRRGNIFGTVGLDGAHGKGYIYELIPGTVGYTFRIVHDFGAGDDAAYPNGELLTGPDGSLYGTAQGGGSAREGAVFKIDPSTAAEKVVFAFAPGGAEGRSPAGGLISDARGNLYGSTIGGGAHNFGVVFELTKRGAAYRETILYAPARAGTASGFVLGPAGELFGTVSYSASHPAGAVVALVPTANGPYDYRVVHEFTGGTDGGIPEGGLAYDASGNIWGTTYVSHPANGTGCGTAFELTLAGSRVMYRVRHEFGRGNDGCWPTGTLVVAPGGGLFGTTQVGGGNGNQGTLFSLWP